MAEKKRGRDYKPGLDRTQFDTNFARKSASLSIRQKYGLEGLAVLYEVIVWINEEKGCYAEAPTLRTAAENFAMTRLFDVTKIDWVMDVFGFMLEIGFFDPEAFEKDQILTSKGIVRRWYSAKRNPDSYPLPESILAYWVDEPPTENEQQCAENEQQIQENEQQCAENCNNAAKEKKRKEKYKQTNKQTKARGELLQHDSDAIPGQPGEPPAGVVGTPPAPPDTEPVTDPERFLVDAMDRPRWDEIRSRIVRLIYSPGLCSDLVDLFAAAGASGWISVPQVRQWVSAAKDERELYNRSNGHAGKKKLWEVLRPLLADVYLAHGMELPACDPHRQEPPPPPSASADVGYDAATRAGRAVMAMT